VGYTMLLCRRKLTGHFQVNTDEVDWIFVLFGGAQRILKVKVAQVLNSFVFKGSHLLRILSFSALALI